MSEHGRVHVRPAALAVGTSRWQWWYEEQFAEAESRFTIVTLTVYLIDISFL